jgi:hypothetical protein
MKTSVVILFFFFIATDNISASRTDSIGRHSFSITLSPLALASWSYPDYEYNQDNQDGYGVLQNRNRPCMFWPLGISYRYNAFSFLRIEAGINYSTEENKIRRVDFYENGIQRKKSIDYKEDFIQIPLSFVFYPYSKKALDKSAAPLFIKIGASFDWVAADNTVSTSSNYYDNHFSPPQGYDYNIVTESAGAEKNKIRFNRVSPLISFGQNIPIQKKINLFYTMAMFQLRAVYQKRNTVEYFKNFRYALITFGVTYTL